MKQIKQFLLLATLFVSGVMWGGNVCTVYDNNGTELISYENLGDAFNFAVNNPNLTMHIVMTADYTLPAGDYTLPANASLLIPHKADQKKPYGEDPWRISELETPAVFRTLTFANGVNIVVKGMLEISSQQYVASASTNGTGRVAGAYGLLTVADGCNVWLDKGSKLCAWGYMKGNGNVQAKRGATVYEMFQVYDWKGGTNISTHFLENHHGVFPFSEYFIQNIEMPVTYQPGSQLLTSFGITIYGSIYSVNNIGIIGTRGSKIKSMFEMGDVDTEDTGAWVRKSYNPTTDRQVYEINNAAYINAMTIKVMGFTFSSDEYQLPITHNMDIHLLSGYMDITQDLTMFPGSQIEVDKESTVRLLPNKNVYLYDLDQWERYAYNNLFACKVWYSPSWPTKYSPRDVNKNGLIDKDELTDASINIHGTLELHGNIFTTTNDGKTDGGANIFSNNIDAGTVQFADVDGTYTTPEDSAVYQWKQTTFPEGKFYGAKAPSAWLLNGDNSFVKTGDLPAPAGKSLCYINNEWTCMKTEGCFVYDEVNKKWYIKPAGYVQIFVESAEPEENDEHLYTDVDKTRLFLLEEANCQWWEVTKDDAKDAYYCAANGRYYRYNGDDEEWQEAKVVVTFNPANGQDAVPYDVKLGAVPQYVGDDPVKEQDQTGSYTFQGWSSDGGTNIYKFNPMPEAWDDITYTAQYNTILRKYLITFANAKDGANVYKEFEYNQTPSYDGTPTKANDNLAHDYTFVKWDKEFAPVTEATTYTAQFEGTPYTYTITWLKENGELFTEQTNVEAGTNITVPEYTETIPDGYTFAGWRNNATNVVKDATGLRQDIVTGDATYQAVLAKDGYYRISFVGEDGIVYSTQYVEPNAEYTYEGATPTKSGYDFIGWSPTFYTRAIATEDVTYTAHFRISSGYNVAEVTTESGAKQYSDFVEALNAVCAASGDVTLKMLKSIDYTLIAPFTIQSNTNLTMDLNGCEINLTGMHHFLVLSGGNDVIICDNSDYQGGKVSVERSFINFIGEQVTIPSHITMKSGAIIRKNADTSYPIFYLKGDNSTFTMNGGYVEEIVDDNRGATSSIFQIVGSNQSLEFNGGKWYFDNEVDVMKLVDTYAIYSGSSSSQNFHFTMNGGEIELKGMFTVSVFYSLFTSAHVEVNNGRLSAYSGFYNAIMFDIPDASSVYINSGELSAIGGEFAEKVQIIPNTFTGQIIGGKFKVSAPETADLQYFGGTLTAGIKGGFYNIFDSKVSNSLSNGFVMLPLKESDSEYAEGYRYQVAQGGEVQWKNGFVLLEKTGAKVGDKITIYPGGDDYTWYKDKECTQLWDFDNDVMPTHTLMLYTKLEGQEVQVSVEGEDTYCSFSYAWNWAKSTEDTRSGTIKLLKPVSFAADAGSIAKDVTLDLNEKKLTSTGTKAFITIPSNKTLTINGVTEDSEISGAGNLFVLQGGKIVMNGGYCHSASGKYICYVNDGTKNEIVVNGGRWYGSNSNSYKTIYNIVSGTKLTMTGGTIEASSSSFYADAISSVSYSMEIEISGGKIVSTVAGGGKGYMFNVAENSTINISGGEFIGQTKGTSSKGELYIFKNKAEGKITSGKFRVDEQNKAVPVAFALTELNAGYISTGCYFDRIDENVKNALEPNLYLRRLPSTDPEYEKGYRFKVVEKDDALYVVSWNIGDLTIEQSNEPAEEKIARYELEPNIRWYKDKAMTTEWRFDTDVMPNTDLTLYCSLSNPEVCLTRGSETLNTYFDLAVKAINNNQEGGTITLLKDLTVGPTYNVNKTLILDLKGKKLTFNGVTLFTIESNQTLTITDGSAKHDGQIIAKNAAPLLDIKASGNFILNGGTCKIAPTSSTPKFSTSANNSSITINGGKIDISTTGTYSINVFNATANTPKFTMTAGEIIVKTTGSKKDAYVFYSSSYAWNIIISSGKIDNYGDWTSYIFYTSASSNINISGGEFISSSKQSNPQIFCNNFTGEITGGKFKSISEKTGGAPVIFGKTASSATVKGGYYNVNDANVSARVASGCQWLALPDGHPLKGEYAYYVSNPEVENLTVSDDEVLPENTTVSGTVTIKKNGRLTVPTGITLTTNDFIIEATTTESGELINAGTVTVNGNAYFDLTFNAQAWTGSEWYSFAVPFEVDATSGISYGGAPLTLGTDIDILYYDGATRAAKGANKSAWKYVENLGDKTLVPGKLYMAAFLADKPNAVRFTKKSGAELIFSGELNLDQYSSTQSTDAGWNAIANPTLHHATLTATDITEGQVYVNGEDRYAVVTLASDELVVGRPIMIQTNANKSVVINTPAASAPVRKLMTKTSSNYSVALSQDGKTTDRVIVAIDDYAIDEYTIGQDLAKAGVSTKVAQMWVDRYDAQLCKNTVAADNNMAEYPLTISAPKAGEYTIALEQIPTDGVLFLTENGSITWNLNIAPATLDLSKGTDTTYGLRLVRKSGDVVTGNNEVILNGDVQKVIINDRLYILRDGKVYNAHGHVIK